jgi:hypothetical protein
MEKYRHMDKYGIKLQTYRVKIKSKAKEILERRF